MVSSAGDSTAADSFWESTAAGTIHWYHAGLNAWLTKEAAEAGPADPKADRWVGWKADAAAGIVRAEQSLLRWTPWDAACDDASTPVIRWFHAAQTNAAFNEIDRHVLMGHGNSTALIGVTSNDGMHESLALHALLCESAAVARALIADYCLVPEADRMAIYLQNDARAVAYIEAAKRAGVPYVAVASGTSSRALASRLADTGAAVLVTSADLVSVAQEARQLVAVPPAGVLVPPATTAVEGWQLAVSAHELAGDGSAVLAPPEQRVAALWRLAPPRPVDASFPLFILYTSG